jgi:hypothetical protein
MPIMVPSMTIVIVMMMAMIVVVIVMLVLVNGADATVIIASHLAIASSSPHESSISNRVYARHSLA